MRAKVIYQDGFHTSPTIETTDENLRARLVRSLSGDTPALCATALCVQSVASGVPASIHNTPEGRTYGITRSMIEREDFWPGTGDQAGVFCVNLTNMSVDIWGGKGFDDSAVPFAPGMGITEPLLGDS